MIRSKLKDFKQFLRIDLWKTRLETLHPFKAWVYRQLRILLITFSEFGKDKCGEKASALTYFSLLSIVPVIAMAFGIATIFGLESYLQEELTRYFSGQAEVLEYAITFSNRMLENASGGVISGISAVFLIYAVARLLSNIEHAFNDIWAIKQSRTFIRKISDYMSIILLGPLLLILSSSVTVFVTTQIETRTEQIELLGYIQPILVTLLSLAPYTLVWLLLFLFYLIFPNTSVKPKPALIAGILAGTLYQLAQWAWINGQVYLSNYNAIYGSLALLPLLLIWLQLSWTIVLLGAEYSFAMQNVKTWSYNSEELVMNLRTKKKMIVLVLLEIVTRFKNKGEPISFSELCALVPLPFRFVREICQDLEKAKLINQVRTDDESEQYQPAMDINQMDIYTVYTKVEKMGMSNLPLPDTKKIATIEKLMQDLDKRLAEAPANKLIGEL